MFVGMPFPQILNRLNDAVIPEVALMKKLQSLFVVLAVLAVLTIACSQTAGQAADKTTGRTQGSGKVVAVAIKGYKFAPVEVNIKKGETVVWTNEDAATHTVETSDGTLKSGELVTGAAFQHTFTKAGKYEYVCGLHSNMHGSVTVQ